MLNENPSLILLLALLAFAVMAFWKQILFVLIFLGILLVFIGAADVVNQVRE